MTPEKRYKKYLKDLITQVEIHLTDIDKIMKLPESNKRGQLIAKSCNNLDLVKDMARHFGLGLPFKKKVAP
ncbi:hypothetical protein LCGC14_0406240 [marine sediment metagenome]|uniref:Uncharacterized protein n=1 Tax=marine sediment metagenome TaxID=412755 RepID=A0A0F9SVC3_9ZZZZ